MLPTNVMSFMKKMVATETPAATGADTQDSGGGGTFGKLKQTLSSSLMTAQDKVNKMSPRPSIVPEPDTTTPETPTTTTVTMTTSKPEPGKPPNRTGACRVCLKAFKPGDFSRTCYECTQRVCEDCASYSKLEENEDSSQWKCSICRRKIQSRMAIPQDSTDSLLDIPVLEALQRRHSDVKIGSSRLAVEVASGLAPPRSPELRRHSDVSPASLKELEKLKGTSKAGSRVDLDWIPKSRKNSPPRRGSDAVTDPTNNHRSGGGGGGGDPPGQRSRRMSRTVVRQHSYDDDIKTTATDGATKTAKTNEPGLGLPAPMPRRASAYDVYAPGVLAQAQAVARAADSISSGDRPIQNRRSSFRAIAPEETKKEPVINIDSAPNLGVDDDRRLRRRGSQLPDISALRNMPVKPRVTTNVTESEAPRRQQSIDGEAIKIVIHDVDSAPVVPVKRRLVLRRDLTDKSYRSESRGFGLRVVGGKSGIDGHLFSYIVWTTPGGPAEKLGLKKGDKVLEWAGMTLTDRSFEEVSVIIEHTTGDSLELVVEPANDARGDLLDDQIPQMQRKLSDAMIGLQIDPDNDKTSPSSPTRRKLPKTPEQLAREKQVSGRVQLQVSYHDERRELVVAVLAGDDLAPRDDTLGYGNLPEAFAKLRLLPYSSHDQLTLKTEVAPASQNPIWNANLTFPDISGEDLMNRNIEVTLWDLCPYSEPVFLGECTVDVEKAFIDDRAVWYRLEDPKQLRGLPAKSQNTSPRGSIGGESNKIVRKNEFGNQRSTSDDLDSIGECTSLLHPDYAWQVGGGSRRGSSQSEQLEVEIYQLGRDFSRSLPGSRRSSFQSPSQTDSKEQSTTELDVQPPANYHRERRRSSCTRMLRDPDEILRSLKAVKGELGRTMSFSGSADKRSRRSSAASGCSRKNSIFDFTERSPPEEEEESEEEDSELKLGPNQIQPRAFKATGGRHGAIKIGLIITKGYLEVDIIRAKNICSRECDSPPDTYVKCYLRDGEKWLLKKKTRVARRTVRPYYRQTLRYQASDVPGRKLLVMIWERQSGFEHNQGMGGAEILLDDLQLSCATVGWYPLFPINSLGANSIDSP